MHLFTGLYYLLCLSFSYFENIFSIDNIRFNSNPNCNNCFLGTQKIEQLRQQYQAFSYAQMTEMTGNWSTNKQHQPEDNRINQHSRGTTQPNEGEQIISDISFGNNPLDLTGFDPWKNIHKHQRYTTQLGEDSFGLLSQNAVKYSSASETDLHEVCSRQG